MDHYCSTTNQHSGGVVCRFAASKTKGSPYLASLMPFSVPRPEMVAVKDAVLKRDAAGESCPFYVVTGAAGCGKTQALLQLASYVLPSPRS